MINFKGNSMKNTLILIVIMFGIKNLTIPVYSSTLLSNEEKSSSPSCLHSYAPSIFKEQGYSPLLVESRKTKRIKINECQKFNNVVNKFRTQLQNSLEKLDFLENNKSYFDTSGFLEIDQAEEVLKKLIILKSSLINSNNIIDKNNKNDYRQLTKIV